MEEVIGSIPIRSTIQLNNLGRAFSGAGQTFVSPPPAAGWSLSFVILGLQDKQKEIEGKMRCFAGTLVLGIVGTAVAWRNFELISRSLRGREHESSPRTLIFQIGRTLLPGRLPLLQRTERLRAGASAENASSSERPPITSGVLWCMPLGMMFRIGSSPLVAIPPACSAINASGLAS